MNFGAKQSVCERFTQLANSSQFDVACKRAVTCVVVGTCGEGVCALNGNCYKFLPVTMCIMARTC